MFGIIYKPKITVHE